MRLEVMKRMLLLIMLLTGALSFIKAQTDTSGIEITIIDSYITPELPHKFVLSFFTSDSCTASLNIENKYKYKVTEKPSDTHKIEVDISRLKFDSLVIHYTVTAKDRKGAESSQSFEVTLSDESLLVKNRDLNLFNVCCIGGVFFGLPSPGLILKDGASYASWSKEIPLFSFYSGGYNYPAGYIGAEYKYIPKFSAKHQLALGYKQVFQLPVIEFVSPGVNYFTNFLGKNGISFETSIGLFRFYNIFTVYTRYRFNQFLGNEKTHYHEFSVGLYSNFFSLNL